MMHGNQPHGKSVLHCRLSGYFVFLIFCLAWGAVPVVAAEVTNSTATAQIINVQVPFIQNSGQQPDTVKFYSNTFYGTAYVTDTNLTHAVAVTKDNWTSNVILNEQFISADDSTIRFSPLGKDPAVTKVTYFIGNDSSKWQTGIPTYNSVSLGELYPGITVSAKAHGNNVEKLFTVAPGADPTDIRVKVLGAKSISVAVDGSLTIATSEGEVSMAAPKAFQDGKGVAVTYCVINNDTYGFAIRGYDQSKTLVIDPSLVYSTYLGGSSNDNGYGIAVDSSGNTYITGTTQSLDYPTTTGAYSSSASNIDVFISKINPAGSGTNDLIYSTYVGGTLNDYGYGITVDSSGSTYITGHTTSDNFPTTDSAFNRTRTGTQNAFVTKLNPSGTSLLYSTYIGGNKSEEAYGITIDSTGNIFITGNTLSANFPVTTGAYQIVKRSSGTTSYRDGFICKINPAGDGTNDLIYSTYIGGSGSYSNLPTAIALDNSGNIYVTGYTKSKTFPNTTGAYKNALTGTQDGFVSKINPAGTGTSDLVYSTYLGGASGSTTLKGISVDTSGNIYVAGYTSSTAFPTTTGAYKRTSSGGTTETIFSKITPAGSGTNDLVYSTYLGGDAIDYGYGIAIDNSGYAYITGSTTSSNFPTSSSAYQKILSGGSDAFFSKINPVGNGENDLIYSSYFGGSSDDVGNAIAVNNSDGSAYITGNANSGFPTTSNSYNTTFGGGSYDTFVTKFSESSEQTLTSITVSPTTASVLTGGNLQFTATAKDQTGNSLSDIHFTWSCDNETIGTVNTDGLFTAASVGTANVTAANGTVSGKATVMVSAPTPDVIAVSITLGSPVIGQPGIVNVTIRNIGTGSAGEFNVSLLADSVEVNRTIVSSLAVSESKNVSILWTPSSTGSVSLSAIADPENTLGDSNTPNNTVSKTVTVLASYTDLSVSSFPEYYVYKPATITATITNGGTVAVSSFNVTFLIDGNTTTKSVSGLTAGASTSLSVADPVLRGINDTVPITITVDPENAITEDDETNNVYSGNATISWSTDGYAGKHWTGEGDIVTRKVYDIHGDLIGSFGNSVYKSASTSWTASDLPIPANATVTEARFYSFYNWDGPTEVMANVSTDGTHKALFNGVLVPVEVHYTDRPHGYAYDYPYGVVIYNVTSVFSTSGNSVTVQDTWAPISGMWLAVVYEDPDESRKLIFVNEEYDVFMLPGDYHEAFAPFTGPEIDTANITAGSRLITLAPHNDDGVGTLTFNGKDWLGPWRSGIYQIGYSSKLVSNSSAAVKTLVQPTGNEAVFDFRVLPGSTDVNAASVAILKLQYQDSPGYPNASFTSNATSGTAPVPVEFTDLSRFVPTSREWEFGDGSTSTDQDPVHTYTVAGTYPVRLTVSNAYGSSTTSVAGYVTVTSPPVANFTANTTYGSMPMAVQFNDTSTGIPTSWNWSFGDGNISREQNPVHTYVSTGTYSVNLSVANADGSDSLVRSTYITVIDPASAPPLVTFTMDATSGQVPFTVRFTDTSVGSPTAWTWNFGDGSSSSSQSPSHTYVTAGTYSVTLAETGPGGSNSTVRTNAVTVTEAPIANNYYGSIPLSTVKTGAVSGDLWFDSYPTYVQGGTATKTFTVPNHTAIKWARLYITMYVGHMQENNKGNLTLGIDANGDDTYELQEYEVFNTSYSYPYNGGTGRVWLSDHMNRVTSDYFMWYDLTDAISGNTVNVRAVPAGTAAEKGGIKAMTLVVAYDDGDSDRVWYWVNQGHDTVSSNDEMYYSYTGSTVFGTSSAPTGWDSAALSALYLASEEGVYTFRGSSLAGGTPLGNYYGNDTWAVSGKLVAYDNSTMTYTHGSSSTYYKIPLALLSIRYPAGSGPVAGFSATPVTGAVPLTVTFTDDSLGDVTGRLWEFGDGNTSTLLNPVYTYNTTGRYTVNLTVTNTSGRTSRLVKTGYIHAVSGTVETPVASFTADGTTGGAPLTVQFTDTSTNSPTSWLWEFGDGNISSVQNPSHTYATVGKYTVNLTAGNSAGNNTISRDKWITATAGGDYDLTITGSVAPKPDYVFARENNTIQIAGIKNVGNSASPSAQIKLQSSDGFSGTATVPALNRSETVTISVIDTTIRSTAGSTVSYTATIDPDNALTETNEANNTKTGSTYTVLYNGYKGKTYWTGGSNVTTYRSFDIPGGLVYSSGDSAYHSGTSDWSGYTVTWSAGNLPIPEGSTIKDARLYVPYTWDNSNEAPDKIHISFNGNATQYETWYHDVSNFGSYPDYVWGLVTYDVTDTFRTNSANTAVFSRDTSGTKISPYGFTLAVVYENANSTRKQIFLNEEFDLLGASESDYATTPDEATAYVPFTGPTIDTSDVSRANLTTFVPSGYGPEGTLLFNGNTTATNVWNHGDTQVAVDTRDVKSYLVPTGNIVGIRSTSGTATPSLAAAQQFLVVEYNTATTSAPEAAFIANVTSGTAPLPVRFKDISNGPGITSWNWDFGDGSTGTGARPAHTYSSPGTYTVNLTVTSPYGTSTATGTIAATLGAPVTSFTADVTSGNTPLTVQFTDTSTRIPTNWSWDFGDNSTASTVQNPVHNYTLAGLYTVKLTASNVAGSNTATRSNYINVTAYKVQESSFALAGVQASGTGSDQTVTINATQANTTGSIVNVTCCGSNWSYLQIQMNGTPTNGGSTVTGTVDTVKAVTEPVTVPIASVGTPTVQIELVLDEMPDSTAAITQTITQDPDATASSSFSAAASGNGKQIDAIAYTLNVNKTGIGNRVDNSSGIILNATITMAVNASWVTSHGGTGCIVIMRRADDGSIQILTPQVTGPDSSGNYVFTAVSPGLSTFILSSVSAKSSGGSGGDSGSSGSSGGSGGSSGSTAKSFVGAVYDFLASPLSAVATDSTVTYVSTKGAVESGWILAPDLTTMPDAKASWSAEITDTPDGGGKITTTLLQTVPNATLGKFRAVLANQDLALDSVAYGLDITKTNIPGTRNATVTMTASPAWVINTSGVDSIRILRLADDGTARVLTTGFTEYDLDTSYLTFQAQSPDGLCTFALVSVKPGTGTSAGVSGPEVTPAEAQNRTASPQSQEFPLIPVIIAGLVLVVGVEIVAIIHARRKNARREVEEEWDDDYDEDYDEDY